MRENYGIFTTFMRADLRTPNCAPRECPNKYVVRTCGSVAPVDNSTGGFAKELIHSQRPKLLSLAANIQMNTFIVINNCISGVY